MRYERLLLLAGTLSVTGRSAAQQPQLVHCTAAADVACFSLDGRGAPSHVALAGHELRVLGTAQLAHGTRIVIVADPAQFAALGRTALPGRTTYRSDSAASRWTWNPPILSAVMFRGVADSAAVPSDAAEAMRNPGSGFNTRPFIAALVFVALTALVLVLPTIAWGDPQGAAPVPRALAPSTAVANLAPREPRSPDDSTLQTARRTALGR